MDPFYNPIIPNPINDPIGTARRMQQANERQALAARQIRETEDLQASGPGGASTISPVPESESAKLARLEHDPETPKRIVELAGELIRRYPNDAVPILVDVEIPGRVAGLGGKVGVAEAYRAWPIGPHQYLYQDSVMWAEMAVTSHGKVVAVRAGKATVRLEERMRWHEPPSRVPWGKWMAATVLNLEAELAARSELPPQRLQPAESLSGAVSERAARKAYLLRDKRSALISSNQKYVELYGTRANPRLHGKPTRAAEQAWRRLDRVQREIDAMNREIERLGVNIPPAGLLM